jgi:predicted RNA methylase
MSLFGIDLYPTPKEVIEKMLQSIDLVDKVVLEPSAGTGNIVEYVKQAGAKEVLACEIDVSLRKILSGKCHLIEYDFLKLTAEKVSHIDYIIMNPPFMADEKHILHAFDIAPAGCVIITLCNESLIKNNYSRTRKQVIELVKYYGRSDSFGDCFSTAERKTNVEVACLWIYKQGEKENEFDGFFDLHDYEQDEIDNSGIVRYNFIQDIVSRYVESVKMFESVEEINNKISVNIKSVTTNFSIGFGAHYTSSDNHGEITRDVFKKELQKSAWKNIFAKMNMHKYVTKGVLSDINKFVEQQIHVPFTVRNVYKMIQLIVNTHGQRMDQVLIEAFEKICSYSADNSSAGEKWRTNSDYMVNRKFIKPYMCEWDARWPKNYVCLTSYAYDSLDDIVKALCFLTGKSFDIEPNLREVFNYTTIKSWGEWHDWSFFRVKGYKKGTMHFEFKNEDVWEKFNRRVAEIKGWNLPKSTRKAYQKKEGIKIY